jgi:hypothetical protein
LNPGAGDPLALVDRAIQGISHRERDRVPYAIKALLLDYDRMGQAQDRDALSVRRAAECNLLLIWQRPVHECFLLRHLEGCETLKPTKDRCAARLLKEWPEYSKPMTADRLAERLKQEEIRRACAVEPDLDAFFHAIGWTP